MDAGRIIRLLRALGANVEIAGPGIRVNDKDARVIQSRRSPSPAELHAALRGAEHVVVCSHRASPSAVDFALAHPELTLILDDALIHEGTLHPLGGNAHEPESTGRGPKPYARLAVTRALLRHFRDRPDQKTLASLAGATQGSVSAALRKLPAEPDPGALFDEFLATYPGPGGQTYYWWSDQQLVDQARTLQEVGALLSGDYAADAISAWRVPEKVIGYSTEPIDLARHGFALATADDYTAAVVVPADKTIWATAAAWGAGVADPLIAAYDIARTATTGDDDEAIARLREYVTTRARG
ncbi:hypothetical protein NQ166_08805 [Microbacterium sp. zg.Y1090]|uniref:hypothetical protein n=1 Tax=Microbacterium wangruii TaxID=3049073 RepID=UPI00214D7CF4|nr:MULTISPECIES: hypothetical protein [unclassified Microbacterium]MCR2818925.1 hypothetical protein [Microbacterium sp. zg.Y1090]WIM27232.1 hypothetical protein QNO26_08615 [Microbacterium sp. zg-Y1090]